MKRTIISAVLILVAVTLIVSVSHGAREEITLTTIVPDQHILRVQKGIVSETNYRTSVFPDTSIPAKSLIIDEGNIGLGTTAPKTKTGESGFLDAKDVWVRDANDGDGAWASAGGGGLFDQGYVAQGGYTTPVSFAVSFSGINSVSITGKKAQGVAMRATVSTPTTSGFTIYDPDQQVDGYYWQAWGD